MDIVEKENTCYGAVLKMQDGSIELVEADDTVLASGGIGGLYRHSQNFRHLNGDALAISARHGV